MKRRQLALICALVLALFSGAVFTACSFNIGIPSPEEIAAQKEAEERKAALAPYVGIWEAKSIEDENKGTVTEDMYKDVRALRSPLPGLLMPMESLLSPLQAMLEAIQQALIPQVR